MSLAETTQNGQVIRQSLPFLAVLLVVLLLVSYVPAITLTLPNLLSGT